MNNLADSVMLNHFKKLKLVELMKLNEKVTSLETQLEQLETWLSIILAIAILLLLFNWKKK